VRIIGYAIGVILLVFVIVVFEGILSAR